MVSGSLLTAVQAALPKLLSIAVAASKEVLAVYETDFTTEIKSDKSPLTEADLRSNEVITAGLKKIILKDNKPTPILSEESAQAPYVERKEWQQVWIVDPLDGTKEFVKRNGEFTINIGLADAGVPLAGVVFVPVTGIAYFGVAQLGAYRIDTTEVPPSEDDSLNAILSMSKKLPLVTEPLSTYTVVGSRSHGSEEFNQFIEQKKQIHGDVELITAGSALKLCLLAEGRANIYPRFGPTCEWDTAAPHALLKAVGKNIVEAESGEELSYNREDIINPSFIAE